MGGIKSISSAEYKKLTRTERARIWAYEHPKMAKITRVVGLILGAGLLISLPLAIPSDMFIPGALVGGLAVAISLILWSFRFSDFPIACLWSQLETRTPSLSRAYFLSDDEVNNRLPYIQCPRATAISVNGRYLHANRVGERGTDHSFIASQSPMEKDYELYWQAVFEKNATIIDLTNSRDQTTENPISIYYPEKLDQTIQYGSMSVTLIKINGPLYTYRITNMSTSQTKELKRYHYTQWQDDSAISLTAFSALIQKIGTLTYLDPEPMLWIQCRVGLDRTGTVTTAFMLKKKIETGEINEENLDVSLLELIVNLRQQRGRGFVYNKHQLNLLRQYARSLLKDVSIEA